MAVSDPQNDRATPADIAFLAEVADCWWREDPFYGNQEHALAARRILNSLRAAPPPAEDARAFAEEVVSEVHRIGDDVRATETVASLLQERLRAAPVVVPDHRRIPMRQQIADIIEAKVGYTNGWAIPHVEWSDKALEAADEILALTSHGVAPDREALARALYAAGRESEERMRARLEAWDNSPRLDEWTRQDYTEMADRLVRILGGFPAVERSPDDDEEMERQMQEAWRKDLEDAVEDAIHTLTNEVRAGTVFNEAGWVHGTLAMLKRVDPCLRETSVPQDQPPADTAPSTPAVQQEPFVWLARPRHGGDRLVWSEAETASLGNGWTVTPLYAGLPVDHSQEG